MSEERKRILGMLANGKISAEEAEELLDALGGPGGSGGPRAPSPQAGGKAKYLRVVVDSSDGDKVNVRVPLQLLRAGVKLSSLMPEDVRVKVDGKLKAQGLDIDLNNLGKDQVDEVIEGLKDMTVDVASGDGSTVQVFCE